MKIQRELKDKENIIDMISSKQDNGFEDDTKDLFGVQIALKFFYLVIIFSLTFIALLVPELIRFFERIKDQNMTG